MILEFHEIEFFEKIAFKFAEKFLMELEYHKKFWNFFIELEFMELQYRGKFEFPKLENLKSSRF